MIEIPTLALVALASSLLGYWLARRPLIQRNAVLEAKCVLLHGEIASASETASEATLIAYKNSDELRALLTLQFENGKTEGGSKSLADYKTSEEFSAVLSLEHVKGKLAGAAEELEKFHITYTPVLIDHETFLSHKVDVGYDMQLHYGGFPVGEPTRRITNHQEKSKDENITRLLEIVGKTLELAAVAATKQKIPVTISKTPRRVTK